MRLGPTQTSTHTITCIISQPHHQTNQHPRQSTHYPINTYRHDYLSIYPLLLYPLLTRLRSALPAYSRACSPPSLRLPAYLRLAPVLTALPLSLPSWRVPACHALAYLPALSLLSPSCLLACVLTLSALLSLCSAAPVSVTCSRPDHPVPPTATTGRIRSPAAPASRLRLTATRTCPQSVPARVSYRTFALSATLVPAALVSARKPIRRPD